MNLNFSKSFAQFEKIMKILFVYLFLFFLKNNLIGYLCEKSGFVFLELVVGCDEQDID
jgi:hypothetical protein